MACIRLLNGDYNDIDAKIMLITSGLGLLVNIMCVSSAKLCCSHHCVWTWLTLHILCRMGFSLHGGAHGHSHGVGHSHGGSALATAAAETGGVGNGNSHNMEGTNINVRAAMIHVIGDFVQVGIRFAWHYMIQSVWTLLRAWGCSWQHFLSTSLRASAT